MKFLCVLINIQRLKDGLKHIYEPPERELITAKRRINELYGPEKAAWIGIIKKPNFKLTHKIMGRSYPFVSRDTGAGILEVNTRAKAERKVLIALELSFANNWIHCQWTYVVDLDTEVLEVFKDAEKKKPDHWFGDVGKENDTVCTFLSSFIFSELPSMKSEQEFLDRVAKDIVSALAFVQPNTVLTRLFPQDELESAVAEFSQVSSPRLTEGTENNLKRSSPEDARAKKRQKTDSVWRLS